MTSAGAGHEVADLRGDIRHWRRGRATVRPAELASDLYVAAFSTLVIGAMLTSVVVNLRRELGIACAGGACDRGRSVLPWLVALACVGAVLAVARLFGPVFVTPAVDSWLMAAPVDRRALLRRRLGAAATLTVVVLPVVVGATFLGGAAPVGAVALSVLTVLLAVVLVGLAAVSQSSDSPGAAGLALGIGATLWLGMLDVATARGPAPTVGGSVVTWSAVVVVVAAVAVASLVLADRRLGLIRRGRAATGGTLAPGLSGALAGLDLAMVHDLLMAHRFRARESVRSRRGGPSGPAALVWLGLVRLGRDPRGALVVLATVVVTYAAAEVGAGRATILVAVVTGFLAGLPLLAALRVVTRTPALRRALPFPIATTRWATLAVPVTVLVGYGLATTPALLRVTGTDVGTGVLTALAVGLGAATAAARWVAGRPPDYARPLVSTPGGAVPTNLYGSVVRGFDVSVLVSLPLLLTTRPVGAVISLAISGAILQYLAARE